ncbi:hypothetical protein E4U60_000096 [Claviceps pazoutovae]|uniref:Uncharacterized protein n=1 Tax=Claviceps pazoutovae TaxID=1649127 RepID=A0A9P7SJN4_9HYPO|nr:hypothetical protein E4U60_000096 [Claviceps pazoutovae]
MEISKPSQASQQLQACSSRVVRIVCKLGNFPERNVGKEIEKGSHQADLAIMSRTLGTLGTIEIPLWKLVNSTERAHEVFAADAKLIKVPKVEVQAWAVREG